jgi:hypothetical protein
MTIKIKTDVSEYYSIILSIRKQKNWIWDIPKNSLKTEKIISKNHEKNSKKTPAKIPDGSLKLIFCY